MNAIDFSTYCSHPGYRDRPATYKIAAEWIGGGYTELKTFGFANDQCVAEAFCEATRRARAVRPDEEEGFGPIHLYVLSPGLADRDLPRAFELEQRLVESLPPELRETQGRTLAAGG